MDICVGTILEAEKMPKANKLLILKVDTESMFARLFQELQRVLNLKKLLKTSNGFSQPSAKNGE
jgi:tRNA-binding EMAP/Myf-like protein